LIHWRSTEAAAHILKLRNAGYEVEYEEEFRPGLMKEWRESPPDVFAIDLSRLPSHGREIAIALRQSKATRSIPIVFCDGDSQKVAIIRELLPDAAYCELRSLAATLKKALAAPPRDAVRPVAMMDRYKARSAAEKLGIREGNRVAVVGAPRDYDRVLGPLPSDVDLQETENGDSSAHVHLCFAHHPDHLVSTLSSLRRYAKSSKLWILWRKGGKSAAGDVTERLVRATALDLGLVDYKICSVNEIWTAMCFALKR
jgi:CheY-like chemotaxis protein